MHRQAGTTGKHMQAGRGRQARAGRTAQALRHMQ